MFGLGFGFCWCKIREFYLATSARNYLSALAIVIYVLISESGIIADISLGSEDTDGSGNHWHVERSNSSVTSASLDSSMSPTSPVSPTDEDKNCLAPNQAKENNSAQDLETDQEELTIKL